MASDTATLQDRARAAAVELELERSAARATRLENGERRARETAGRHVAAWLEANHLDDWPHLIGPPQPAHRDTEHTWDVPVAFANDDGPDLAMVARVTTGGDLTAWSAVRHCVRCGQQVTVPAGSTLADLGRALERDVNHRCGGGDDAVIIDRHMIGGTNGPVDPTIAKHIAELEGDGYYVTIHVSDSWLVTVARRESHDDLSF